MDRQNRNGCPKVWLREFADISYNNESKRFGRPGGTEFTDADFTKLAERGRADAETAVMAAT